MTFQIIPNRPNDTDAFSGAHCHIAVSLHNLILNNKDSVVVGLDGKRGSGKSTIVQIIRKSFENNNNVKIVSIDAWAHGGNHLRRACLETLADELQSEDETNDSWIDKKWAERFQQLDVKEATKHVKPAAVSKFAIMAPIAIASFFYGFSFLDEIIDMKNIPEIGWRITLALLFCLPPIIYAIYSYCMRKKEDGFEEIITSLLNINTAPEALITIKSAPDQSSILFQKWFMEMLAPLSESPKKKLVIVFDNLDRLNMTEQKAAWQTLQTFLEARENCNFPQNITFIICFDLSAHPTQASQAEMNDRFEKILDTRFHVPMMPLGKWADLAENALEERDFDEASCKEIIDTLSILYAKDNSFTIRKLTQCANALRTLEAQNQVVRIEGEPPSYKLLVCYWHELNRGDYFEKPQNELQAEKSAIEYEKLTFIERLQQKKIDPKIEIALNLKTEEIIASFAQLYCGLDRSESMDFLLGEPILKALKEGDAQKLKQFSEDYTSYERVLRVELKSYMSSYIELSDLARIIIALWSDQYPVPLHNNYISSIETGIPLKTENLILEINEKTASKAASICINLLEKLSPNKRHTLLQQLAKSSTSEISPVSGYENPESVYSFMQTIIENLQTEDLTYFRPIFVKRKEEVPSFMKFVIEKSISEPLEIRRFIRQISDSFQYPTPSSEKYTKSNEDFFRIIRDELTDQEISAFWTSPKDRYLELSEFLAHYNQ